MFKLKKNKLEDDAMHISLPNLTGDQKVEQLKF